MKHGYLAISSHGILYMHKLQHIQLFLCMTGDTTSTPKQLIFKLLASQHTAWIFWTKILTIYACVKCATPTLFRSVARPKCTTPPSEVWPPPQSQNAPLPQQSMTPYSRWARLPPWEWNTLLHKKWYPPNEKHPFSRNHPLLSEVTLQNSDCTFDIIHPPYWTTPISACGGIFYTYGEPTLHADVPSLHVES